MKKSLFLSLFLFMFVGLTAQNMYDAAEKEGLRRFLRQGVNLRGAQLTPADTVNWYTSEAWVPKIKSNEADDRQACTFTKWTPYRLIGLDFGGYYALGYNYTGVLDCRPFPYLESLSTVEQYVSRIDLSENTRMKKINCSSNEELYELLIAPNVSSLEELIVTHSQIISLRLGYQPMLTKLIWRVNRIVDFRMSSAPNLTYFDCAANPIGDFGGVSSFTNLEYLDCTGVGLTSLDITKNVKLKELRCSANLIPSLDYSQNFELTYLDCSRNLLSGNYYRFPQKLTYLDLSSNAIEFVQPELEELKYLNLSNNNLSGDFYFLWSENLETFDCSNNKLKSIDLEYSTGLKNLILNNNKIKTLDLSNQHMLRRLEFSDNEVSSIDMSHLAGLTTLKCPNNKLASLNLAPNVNLSSFDFRNNFLPFSELPVVAQGRLKFYSPQKDIIMNASINTVVNLSKEYNVAGTITTFKWFDQNGTVFTPYNVGNGRFLIPEEYGGTTVSCVATNLFFKPLSVTYRMPVSAMRMMAKNAEEGSVLAKELRVNVYPNPVTDFLKIDTESTIHGIDIIDLTGRLVKRIDGTNEVAVHDLNSGFYIIKIVTADGQSVHKIKKN